MTNENNPPGRSRRPLRNGAKASGPVQKNGAQDTDMDERREAKRLAVRSRKGDDPAFDRLYERYSEAVRNRIAAGVFLALRDRHLEDLIQDAWILIWKHLGQYKPLKGSFTGFARYWAGIALLRWLARRGHVDIFFDVLKEQRRRYPGMQSADLEGLDNLVHVHPFDDEWDREALAAKADKAIGQLLRTNSHPVEILAVVLAMFDGWPPRKIADKLSGWTLWAVTNLVAGLFHLQTDIPPKRVKAHIGRLRTKLRAKVGTVFRGRRLQLLRRHREARVGDLLVNDFFTGRVRGGRPAEIVKWRSAAATRMRRFTSLRPAAKKNSRHQ